MKSGAINFFGPDAWINGGSPTDGFLSFGLHTKEPFTSIFEASQRYQQAGHGIAAIHNATDMRGNFTWWDNLVGSLMPGHADTAAVEPLISAVTDVNASVRRHVVTALGELGDTRAVPAL